MTRGLWIALAVAAQAQTLSYVASVKPNNSVEPRGLSEYYPGGRLSATAVTVRSLVRTAYRLQDHQIIDAPAWFSTRRYDISAKADGNPPTQQVLLQALLKDHFSLKVHNEIRDLPAFALMIRARNGRLGPRMQKSDFDCGAYLAAPHVLPEPGRVSPCSARVNMGALSAKAMTTGQLAVSLAPFVGRFVVDQTALTDRFDLELKWTPDDAAADGAGPSIFTAIEEQLGLKLVSIKAPVDVLVVDHAEEPAPE